MLPLHSVLQSSYAITCPISVCSLLIPFLLSLWKTMSLRLTYFCCVLHTFSALPLYSSYINETISLSFPDIFSFESSSKIHEINIIAEDTISILFKFTIVPGRENAKGSAASKPGLTGLLKQG